jgi:carbamoyltransferase
MNILSLHFGHDASATILVNGEIHKYYKEERYSKIKRDHKPFFCIEQCVQNFKGKIDYILLQDLPRVTEFTIEYTRKYLSRKFNTEENNIFIVDQSHHTFHAALSFYNSGFDDAICVICDGQGSMYGNNLTECETVFYANYPGNFQTIYKNLSPVVDNSTSEYNTEIGGKNIIKELVENDVEFNILKSKGGVVNLYSTINLLIHESTLENGKSMGLSSYGKPREYPNFFTKNGLEVDWTLFENIFSEDVIYFSKIYSPYTDKLTKEVTQQNYQIYADYAHEIQIQTQQSVSKLIEKGLEKTTTKNVCISGGYGMNILANQYFLKKFPDVNFYFEPMSDDGGSSIGAAKLFYHVNTNDTTIRKLTTTFFHGDLHDVKEYKSDNANIVDISNLLISNKSVAVYRGLSESGQRALGNRSILFNPLNRNCKNLVNNIKKREWYRPFALTLLEDDVEKYFHTNSYKKDPFMTVAFDMREEYIDLLKGIVHVDGTCRIQTVSINDGYLYDLLKEFKKNSGHGLLLNTSFNLAGQPLVETPEDALNTLSNSSLDYLWFEETGCLFT